MIKAKLITPSVEANENTVYEFVKLFQHKSGGGAKLKISAESNAVVFVNGNYINACGYADYAERKIYDEIDISGYIKEENELKIFLHYYGRSFSTTRQKPIGLMFEITNNQNIIAISDSSTMWRLSDSWLGGEVITGQLGFGYSYNASAENTVICDEKNVDKNCKCSNSTNKEIIYNGKKYLPSIEKPCEWNLVERPLLMTNLLDFRNAKLTAQGVFKLGKCGSTSGKTILNSFMACRPREELFYFPTENSFAVRTEEECDGIYLVFDLQKESVGYLSFELEVESECRIDISYGEHLNNLRVSSDIEGRCFNIIYNAKKGKNNFVGYLRRLGLRYVQLFVHAKNVKVEKVGIVPIEYPLKEKKPQFDDLLHKKIYDVSLRTLSLCMHEHYEDCPWREQALYGLDSRIQMLCGYYAFNETVFPKASLKLIAESIREDGLIGLCAPSDVPITIPFFSLAYLLALTEYFAYTDDVAFIKELTPTIDTIISVFDKKISADNLLGSFTEKQYWNFYEWSEGLDGTFIFRDFELKNRYELPLNAMYVVVCDKLAECYKTLDDKKRYDRFAINGEKVKKACKGFYNENLGMFGDFIDNNELSHYSELGNALALYSGLGTEAQKELVYKKLLDNSFALKCTLSMKIFKYDALLANSKDSLPKVLEEIASVWGEMLFNGATTFYETEKGAEDFNFAGSLCHGWSAVPAYIYLKYASKGDKVITKI